jgi:hypothetical protein
VNLTLFQPSTRAAIFSADRQYRYSLTIRWSEGPLVNFVMLNPSTADEYQNDPTVEHCERRARKMGFAGLVVTNLFAFRATDPAVMLSAEEPVGPENDDWILEAAAGAEMVICAWGKDGGHRGRNADVLRLLTYFDLHALKVSESTGEPWHPLYLSYAIEPFLWRSK